MNIKHNRVFRIGLPVITLGLIAGFALARGAEETHSWQGCSDASLNGSYGVYRAGTAPYGAVAAQGIYFFNGEGGWQLRLNISRNGEASLDEEWEGGYTVNADCTGTINEDDARFVIVDDGKGFYLVSLREGLTFNEVGTRIHNSRGNSDGR